MPLIARDLTYFKTFWLSYQTFWKVPGRLLLFVRDTERGVFESVVAGDARVVFVSKDAFLGSAVYAEPAVPGWYRQQMVKIGAARLVETACYLAIDADVFVARPVVSFRVEGHLPLTLEPFDARWLTPYFEGSAAALDVSWVVPTERASWRPPFFFDTQVMRWACDRMEAAHARVWSDVLSVGPRSKLLPFGEVFVYQLAAQACDRWQLHAFVPAFVHDVVRGWPYADAAAQFAVWDPATTFSGAYMFGVVQSCTGIAAERVQMRVLPFLQ
jgi:hypothetical protein